MRRIQPRAWWSRILSMTCAWSVLGIIMGVHMSVQGNGDTIGLIAFAIAGCIVLGSMGCLLGLFFDRARESLGGGLLGFALGLIFLSGSPAISGVEPPTLLLVQGAIVGATCWPVLELALFVLRFLGGVAGLAAIRQARDAPGDI